MACASIHLAIAKEYIKRHSGLNKEQVFAGTLYPDSVEDDTKTHYTLQNRGMDILSHVQGKVDLYAFLKENEPLDDFSLGWFLHLVTDYLFFQECFSKQYFNNLTYQRFCKELYHAYSCLNLYIEEKYNITKEDYEAYPSEYYTGIPYEECILNKKMVDDFITRVASIDIETYCKLLKKHKQNRKPKEK